MRSLDLSGSQQLSQQYKGLGTKGVRKVQTDVTVGISAAVFTRGGRVICRFSIRSDLYEYLERKKRNFFRVCKFKFRLVFSPVSSNRRVYLLQGRVRDPKAAEAHVSECLLQLPEQAGVRSVLEASVGEQVGQLLTDGLDQPGLRDVVVDEAADAVYVTCKEQRRNHCSRRQHCP